MRKKRIQKLTTVAILAALSCVFYMFLKFPLPFVFPSFLDIQLSNLPVILAGLIFGPTEAVLIVLIRFFVKLPFSSTAFVGEIADLIIGFVAGASAALVYHKFHTKKGGIIALVVSSVTWVIAAIIMNSVVLLPWYIEAYGLESVLPMLQIIPGITENNYMLYYILFAVIPFNLLLSIIVNIITFIVYKRISLLYKDEEDGSIKEKITNNRLYIGIMLIVLDLIMFVGFIRLSPNGFHVTSHNPLYQVILTIIGFVVILGVGIYLIVANQIHNKKIKNNL